MPISWRQPSAPEPRSMFWIPPLMRSPRSAWSWPIIVDLESVAIFSHGSEGNLQLGGQRLDSQALAANAGAIQA